MGDDRYQLTKHLNTWELEYVPAIYLYYCRYSFIIQGEKSTSVDDKSRIGSQQNRFTAERASLLLLLLKKNFFGGGGGGGGWRGEERGGGWRGEERGGGWRGEGRGWLT